MGNDTDRGRKKGAANTLRGERRSSGLDSVVVFHEDQGVEVPRGLGCVGSSEPDGRPRLSRGWTLERANDLFWDQLREKRKSSDKNSEFARTWDLFQSRARRMFDGMESLAEVVSADFVSQFCEDVLTTGKCHERLLWRFGGIGDFVSANLEAGMAKLGGLGEANEAKETGIRELKHKVELIRMDEPDAKRPAIARYLLEELETEGGRCHDCQRHERAVARNNDPPGQRCERYERYGRCTPCDVCQAWRARLTAWVEERANDYDVDESGERVEVTKKERGRRNRDAIVKRILRIDESSAKRPVEGVCSTEPT